MPLPQPSSPPLIHHSPKHLHRDSKHRSSLVHHRSTPTSRQKLALQRAQHRVAKHKELAFEVSSMMAINLFISVIAIVTIAKLLPSNASQYQKLRSLEAEVNALDRRVDHLRHEFTNYFDPQQTRVNMRRLSDRLEPGQHKVMFSAPPENTGADSGESSGAEKTSQQEISIQKQ